MATVRMSEKEAIRHGIVPPPDPAATTKHEFDAPAPGPPPNPGPSPEMETPKLPRRQPDMSARGRVPALLPHPVGTYSRPPGNQQAGGGGGGWKLSIAPTTLGKALLALISWLIGFAMGLRAG